MSCVSRLLEPGRVLPLFGADFAAFAVPGASDLDEVLDLTNDAAAMPDAIVATAAIKPIMTKANIL